MNQQHTPLRFNPCTGIALTGTLLAMTAQQFRAHLPTSVWLYNPWTGVKRHALDVQSDARGHLIVPPNEPIYA